MAKYAQLTILHNHGRLVLKDAETDERGYAVTGTVVSGHTTNSLFFATSTTHEQPGVVKSYPLYGRVPRETEPGQFVIDCCFCG
jgi:hypothetical protein